MTDNAFTYVKNRSLRSITTPEGIRHITTQPYRPRTNGKVERFHQTMSREWATDSLAPSPAQGLPLAHHSTGRPSSSSGPPSLSPW